MSYTDTLLASGERIVRRSRQHWFVMVWRARWAVIAVIAAIALFVLRLAVSGSSVVLDILGYVTLLLLLIGIGFIAWAWLQYQNEEFVLTSRRIIHVSGLINKKASDSSLEMINDAVLTESVFGRMFGFGDLEILTASEAGIDNLRMLHDAKAFKKAMIEAKHELALELERPTMPPIRGSSGTASGSSAAQGGSPSSRPRQGGSGPTLTGDEQPSTAIPGWGEPPPTQVPPPPPSPAPATPSPAPAAAPTEPATPVAMTSDDVADALDRLGDLRDRGIVTPEEFEAKKRELLGRL